MFHVVFGAIVIKRFAARHTQSGFHRARGVVNPGVHDFGVARAGVGAESVFGFEDNHIASALRELACNGQADDAGTDNGAIQSFHDD